MKNIFNKFAFFIALSFVFISCGNLTTSENDDSIPQGKGKITISTDLQNGRSVLPTAIKEDTTGLKWELVGTSGDKTYSKIWDDDTDEAGTVTVAYQSMTSDLGIVIDTGTWDFTLTASQNNATEELNVLQAHCNSVQINAGNNALNFVMQEATENAASGSIEFTLNFPENVVTKGIATLTPYEGTNPDTQDFTANAGTTSQFLSSITYEKENISAGYYILKIQLQQEKGDATTPAVEYINTYSCLIRVAPGLLSQGKYTLTDLAQLYTITYKLNEGTFDSTTSAVPTSYNAYTSFALPTPTKAGYEFVGWYTDSELTNPVELDENDKYRIKQDTTLYAKWVESNTITSWGDLQTKIELANTSTVTEFVITEDLTATSTITVSKPVKIISDKNVTITRGNSIDGANFKDAFFEVESAGNLELEGTENITITLDGGKANESPIFATAPLITSSGNLTLTNCILRNNKNESTSVKGGAINISGGTFTMNGGIIGEKITESDTGEQSWKYAATDSKFSNYAYAGGGGIYAVDGTVTIKDAKVSYNYVPDDDKKDNPDGTSLSSGGGICMEKGYLILENTEVSYNRGYLGGGVRCYNDGTVNVGTLTLKNATIKGNAGKHYAWSNFGGALAIRNFDVICDKSAEASIIEENYSADGGAVFLEYTTSTLENIIIRNNSFNDNGYKYGSEMLLWDSAVISIASNTVNISNSEPADRKGIFINNSTDKLKLSGDISLVSPIYLYFENENSSPAVTVAGTLSEDTVATIKLVGSFATEGKLVLEAEEEVTLTDEIIAKFTLENEEFYIDTNGKLAKINTEQNLITKLSSITATNGVKQLPSGVYYLEQNLELDAPVYISSGDVVIYAKNNATISGNINNDCFFVVSNCSLTFGKDELTDATLTINAEKKSDASAVLNAISSGTLNLKNNVICTGATNQSFITTENGTVNISGGKIKENHGASPVINVTGGTVNITGGEISNNSCINLLEDCPAILVSSGTLNISGTTTTISNNTYGISDDTLENQGASIYNKSGTVTILGTTLDQGNKFTQNIVNGVKEDVQNSGGGIAYNVGEVYTDDSGTVLGYIFDVQNEYIKIAYTKILPDDDNSSGFLWSVKEVPETLIGINDGDVLLNTIKGIDEDLSDYPVFSQIPDGWYLPTKDEFQLMYDSIDGNVYGGWDNGFFWTSTLIDSTNCYYFGDYEPYFIEGEITSEYNYLIPVKKISIQ